MTQFRWPNQEQPKPKIIHSFNLIKTFYDLLRLIYIYIYIYAIYVSPDSLMKISLHLCTEVLTLELFKKNFKVLTFGSLKLASVQSNQVQICLKLIFGWSNLSSLYFWVVCLFSFHLIVFKFLNTFIL